VDYSTGGGGGDIYVYDLAASPPVSPQLLQSAGANTYAFTSMSEDGNTVVWENCPTTLNCDIMQAVRTGGAWAISTTTNSPESENDAHADALGLPTMSTMGAQRVQTSAGGLWPAARRRVWPWLGIKFTPPSDEG
jgi:hypothetical protein